MNKRKEKENAIKEVWYRNGNIIYLGETGNEDTKFRKNLIFSKKKKTCLLLTSADHVKYGLGLKL